MEKGRTHGELFEELGRAGGARTAGAAGRRESVGMRSTAEKDARLDGYGYVQGSGSE